MSLPTLASCHRCLHVAAVRNSSSLSKLPWRKEAEQIVGYPTSFLNLRYLLSDEISNVVGHLRKMVGTRHPLLKTARKLLDDETGFQSRGITILLMSKALASSSQSQTSNTNVQTNPSGILPHQRHLSEIIELIYTAELIHDNIVDVELAAHGEYPQESQQLTAEQRAELASGNKLTVLLGDYLLANASSGLGKLYNTEVAEKISQALSDMKVAACLRQSWHVAAPNDRYSLSEPLFTSQTNHITAAPGTCPIVDEPASLKNWIRWVRLAHGSLLSHGCHGTALLADAPVEMRRKAGVYGWHLAMADELHSELQPTSMDSSSQIAPGLLRSLCQDESEFAEAQQRIPPVQKFHATAAIDSLEAFPPSDALQALKRMAEELT
ncbi:all trans-polyprenyl-diphosphate synthase PDSS2-like [Sycon ciliatum]|uniref:all trans-polyprenyl-diphosphate synthase PDSS2-like n=1 Tax=Sycon ciliatum TaxID=27933 RepID=UPI0031F61FBF